VIRFIASLVDPLFRRRLSVQSGRLHYAGQQADESTVRSRLAFAGLSLVVVCLIGTAGYYVVGDGKWSLEDCLYMVLITITSVGYGEVLPLAEAEGARTFTMVLLVGGMGVSFYFLSALTAFIIEGDLREALWRRRMTKQLFDLKDHYIVCGAGRTGRYVVDELVRAGRDVVVIERAADSFTALSLEHGEAFVALSGDATDDRVLKDAGVERAAGLVTALQLDQDNLFVALSARQLNPKLRIVSRANADRVTPKLKQAGADAIVSPTHIGGRRMAHELLRPNVVGFLDFMVRDKQRNLDIEEVSIPPRSPVAGRTLAKSRIREKSSALVLAVVTNGDATYNPPPDFVLDEGMMMLCLGEREQLDRLVRYIESADA
jgi:voltage-gated potassium channel